MIRGLYTSAAAMLAQMVRQQVLAQNLANINTPGYRQDRVVLRQFPLQPLGAVEVDPRRPLAVGTVSSSLGPTATGVLADLPGLNLQQGLLHETGETLDLAVVGPGFFAVQKPDGVFYTRDGRFTRNAEGSLSGTGGALVLGPDLLPIAIPAGPLGVDDGGVIRADGQAVGQIGVFAFAPDAGMEKAGGSMLRVTGAPQAADLALTTIHQGFIETSNVDATQTSAEVLAALRSYEASQRLLQMQDQLLQRVVTEVGRVG